MNRINRSSAFYSGSTRYGGSSAIAKRREAARKAFFNVKEATSSSRATSNQNNVTLNRPNPVHSYTINTGDIIRKEPPTPQLTTSARRILSWIEKNSKCPYESVEFTKRRKTQKHRFDPMSYRAPISNIPKLTTKVANPTHSPPVPKLITKVAEPTHSPPVPKLITKVADPTHSPPVPKLITKVVGLDSTPANQVSEQVVEDPKPPSPKPTPVVSLDFVACTPIIPVSSQFKAPKHCGHVEQIPPPENQRTLAVGLDLTPTNQVSEQVVEDPKPPSPKPTPVVSLDFVTCTPIIPESSQFKAPNYCGHVEQIPPPENRRTLAVGLDLTPTNHVSEQVVEDPKPPSPKPTPVISPTPEFSFQAPALELPTPVWSFQNNITIPQPSTVPAPPINDVEMDIDPGPFVPESPFPAPAFPTPAFSSPVPGIPSMIPISTLPNGSNPFQPPTSNIRGRKILRPTRRLHR